MGWSFAGGIVLLEWLRGASGCGWRCRNFDIFRKRYTMAIETPNDLENFEAAVS